MATDIRDARTKPLSRRNPRHNQRRLGCPKAPAPSITREQRVKCQCMASYELTATGLAILPTQARPVYNGCSKHPRQEH